MSVRDIRHRLAWDMPAPAEFAVTRVLQRAVADYQAQHERDEVLAVLVGSDAWRAFCAEVRLAHEANGVPSPLPLPPGAPPALAVPSLGCQVQMEPTLAPRNLRVVGRASLTPLAPAAGELADEPETAVN